MVTSSPALPPRSPRGPRVGTEGKLGARRRQGRGRHLKDLRTASTRWRATSPRRCATSPKSPPRWRRQPHRRRSRPTSRAIWELKNTINTMVEPALELRLRGHPRAARCHQGKLGGQADVRAWPDVEGPHRQRQLHGRQPHGPGSNIADVTTAVANGDSPRRSPVGRSWD